MSTQLNQLVDERRKNKEPVPDNLEKVLTNRQLTSLNQHESQGWFLWFVRRPPEKPPIPFLMDAEMKSVAILEEDGTLNRDHGLSFRWDLFD